MTEANVTQETSQSLGGIARKQKLSQKRRQEIARKAAASRWGNRQAAPQNVAPKRVARKAPTAMKKPSKRKSTSRSNGLAWRQFNTALVTAEKKLIEANADRVDAWTLFCQLSNEIPTLENTVNALRILQSTAAQASTSKQPNSPYDLAQILSGAMSFAAPQYAPPVIPAITQPVPTNVGVPPPPPVTGFLPPAPTGYLPPSMANPVPVAEITDTSNPTAPVAERPMHASVPQSRAQGYAGNPAALQDEEDENRFLTGPMAGSKDWH